MDKPRLGKEEAGDNEKEQNELEWNVVYPLSHPFSAKMGDETLNTSVLLTVYGAAGRLFPARRPGARSQPFDC